MNRETILLIGGSRPLYKEVFEKVEVLFPDAELVWLRTYSEVEKYFEEGGVAKLVFLGEEPSDYSGQSLLMDINELSENLPIIFA